MCTIAVVIDPESREFSFEVKLVPEKHLVQQLFANCSDHAFNERVRTWYRGHCPNLLDLQDAQIGQPAMESEQRIVVGGQDISAEAALPSRG